MSLLGVLSPRCFQLRTIDIPYLVGGKLYKVAECIGLLTLTNVSPHNLKTFKPVRSERKEESWATVEILGSGRSGHDRESRRGLSEVWLINIAIDEVHQDGRWRLSPFR